MALDSYSNLKTAIANYLDRDDLTDYVDDFIDIAEARHKRDIRIREMLTRSSLTVDDRYVDLPTGYLEAQTLRLLTDPVTVLLEVNLHEMNRIRVESTGKPEFFSIHTQIEFNIDPDESYSGEIVYYKALTALDGSNTSNDLLTRAPDAYLYAALSAAEPFLMNDPRVQLWEALYQNAVDGLTKSDRRSRRSGPQISRVAGATP